MSAEEDGRLGERYGVSREKVAELRVLFDQFDEDGDGAVTVSEIASTMNRCGHRTKEQTVAEILLSSDANGDQKVTFEEFVSYLSPKINAQKTKDRMKEAFASFDRNGDGFLSPAELRDAFATIGEELSLQEAKSVVGSIDDNGDGKISYKEFVKMWKLK